MKIEPHVPVHPGEHERWNESHYVWWYDPNSGLSGGHRIAHLPNDQGGRAQIWHAVLAEDGRRYRRGAEIALDPAWRDGGRYRTEGLQFHYTDGPHGTAVVVTYESADMSAELVFTDVHQAEGNTQLADAGFGGQPEVPPGHTEVGGTISGTVTLRGDTIRIDGLGFRDHTWGGARDFSHIRSSRWTNGTVGEALTFGIAFSARSNGTVATGFVYRDGTRSEIADFDILVAVESDSICWRDAEVLILCDDGSEIEVEIGPAFDGQIFESRELLVFDAPSPARIGGMSGVGNIGMATNARGGREFPPLIMSACYEDGFALRPVSTRPRIRRRSR